MDLPSAPPEDARVKAVVREFTEGRGQKEFRGSPIIVVKCLNFGELWDDIKNDVDQGHHGSHWRNVERMLLKADGKLAEEVCIELSRKLWALWAALWEQSQCGQLRVIIAAWCKSGRDRSPGMITFLANALARVGWGGAPPLHICGGPRGWRPHTAPTPCAQCITTACRDEVEEFFRRHPQAVLPAMR